LPESEVLHRTKGIYPMRFFALARISAPPSAWALFLSIAAGFLALASTPSLAQDDPSAQAGRLSYISGTVSVQSVDTGDWGQAYNNLTLGPGDRIFTDADGRAEIQVGQSYVRIGPNSDVSLVDATPYGIYFGVAQGSLRIHTLGLWPGQALHVQTPNGDAALTQSGEMRVDVLSDEDAAIFTNYSDDLLLSGAGGFIQDIGNWQSMELIGSNPVYPQWLQPADPDGLDNWSRGRDRQIANSISYRYVSPEIPGAAELDANGEWLPGTDYGAVWFPNNVPYGWTPYHYGHWVNHAPWGWVWVEDEPWGYAPFHYGRWISFAGRWGWVPGPANAHPVWSPALVAFAGGIQVGGTGVSAWFPLGPGEPFRPWYHASPRYIDQVNISNISESRQVHVQTTYVNIVNVTNITNITYINRSSGVTAMRHEDFAAGRSAQQTAVKVDPRQFDHVKVLERPEPQPVPRSFVSQPPARPVPVKIERPVFINDHGQQTSAKPGAQPIAPPVKPMPQIHVLPGRTVIAPPPPQQRRQSAPNAPAGRPTQAPQQMPSPAAHPASTVAPQQPMRPAANPAQPPAANPALPHPAKPAQQQIPSPAAHPAPAPQQAPYPAAHPTPAPALQQPAKPTVNPAPQQPASPALQHPARPDSNPVPQPASRPIAVPPQAPKTAPQQPARPAANPVPQPASKPAAQPPTVRPAPQPNPKPVAAKPGVVKPNDDNKDAKDKKDKPDEK
jgi:hypothetical protein